MNAPRLESCYFAHPGSDGRWPRLARVLEYSAHEHCPAWSINVQLIRPGPVTSALGIKPHVVNTQKLDHWRDLVIEAAADGDRLLLMDVDTMIVRPLDDVWARPFDVAYTVKEPGSNFPFNAGVLFLRVSPKVQAFVSTWAAENRRLLGDTSGDWRRTYGGINQAALAHTLARASDVGVTVLELPCREWNAEESAWDAFDPGVTRIVHIKSALRQVCLGPCAPPDEFAAMRALWRGYEKDAHAALTGVAR